MFATSTLTLFIWRSNYFFPASICSFKAAKASMSPKVVEAAWFWIEAGVFFSLTGRLLGSFLFCSFFSLGYIFEDAAVRQDDTLSVLVELDNFEFELLRPTEPVSRLP